MTDLAARALDQPALPTSRPVAGLWSRVLARPGWQQVLVAYAASRVVAGVVIAVVARLLQNPAGVGDLHPDYLDMIVIWDGQWYRGIAEHGYPDGLPLNDLGEVDYNSWAFFPLFPLLVRAVMAIGLPFSVAASAVNLVAAGVAVVLLSHLFAVDRPQGGADVGPQRQHLAALAAAIWCVLPPSAVLQVAYSEALAVLLLAAALLLLVRGRYGAAVPVVLLLGLTRAVAAPLLVVVTVHAWLRWRSLTTSERTRLGGLLVATGASTLLWPAIVAVATGIPSAFFSTQAVWGQEPAKGPFVPWFAWAWDGAGPVGVLLLLGAVAAGGSLVVGRHAAWLSLELRVWALVYPLYLLAVLRPITSMWRFLLLDLPIAGVLASALGRPSVALRWRVAAVVLALAGMVWWVGALLTRTPWSDSPP